MITQGKFLLNITLQKYYSCYYKVFRFFHQAYLVSQHVNDISRQTKRLENLLKIQQDTVLWSLTPHVADFLSTGDSNKTAFSHRVGLCIVLALWKRRVRNSRVTFSHMHFLGVEDHCRGLPETVEFSKLSWTRHHSSPSECGSQFHILLCPTGHCRSQQWWRCTVLIGFHQGGNASRICVSYLPCINSNFHMCCLSRRSSASNGLDLPLDVPFPGAEVATPSVFWWDESLCFAEERDKYCLSLLQDGSFCHILAS